MILAVHAALFEQYLTDASRPFRFLILDTPRQQDMQTGDLAQYLGELSRLCERENAQFVISSTEYRHPKGAADIEWLADFEGFAQPMYLGQV